MKKVLVGATALSLLLAGCGQGEEQKKDTAKTVEVKTEEKEKFISDSEMKDKLQVYIDKSAENLNTFNQATSVESMDTTALRQVSGNLKRDAEEFKKYLNETKEPIKFTEPSNNLINLFSTFGDFGNEISSIVDKSMNNEIADREANKQLNGVYEKFMSKLDQKTLDKTDDFLTKEKIDTTKLDEAYSSSGATEQSASDKGTDSTDTLSLNPLNDFKEVKSSEVNQSINAGPTVFTINKISLGEIPVTEDNSYNFESTQPGNNAQIIILDVSLKNTSDTNVNYYPDQDPITTDTGEQLNPTVLTGAELVTEMKGDVQSSGKIIYELKNSKVQDIHSIEFIAGAYNDPETMDEITPEQKVTINIQ